MTDTVDEEPTNLPDVETLAIGGMNRRVLGFVSAYGIYFVLLILVVIATFVYHGFLDLSNISLVLEQNAPLGIAAVGMTVVLIGGGFDLSVGSTFALSGVLYARWSMGHSIALGLTLGLLSGILCGVLNGFIVTKFRVNPFITTLGTSSIISGFTLLYSNSQSYSVFTHSFAVIGGGVLFGVPVAVIIMVLAFAVVHVLLRASVAGRMLFAVGGNREASRLSGLPVRLVQASTYVVCGTLAGIAGMVSASQLSVGQGSAGSTLALEAIAVVVIGGTSISGGEGSVVRTAIGLLILGVLENIFFSLAVNTNWQLITQGVIVVAAVALDLSLRRWQRSP